MNESTRHCHAGEDLPFHTYFLESSHTGRNGWPTIVIPSTAAAGLAAPGHHVLHATMSEPYAPWEGLSRTSAEYRRLKEERAAVLWAFVRQVCFLLQSHGPALLCCGAGGSGAVRCGMHGGGGRVQNASA